jgi:hypothetical protein
MVLSSCSFIGPGLNPGLCDGTRCKMVLTIYEMIRNDQNMATHLTILFLYKTIKKFLATDAEQIPQFIL